MSVLHNRIKNEILKDHEQNNYKKAHMMPLRDKYDLPKSVQAKCKRVAKRLSDDDDDFPYIVECWIQGETVMMGSKPL